QARHRRRGRGGRGRRRGGVRRREVWEGVAEGGVVGHAVGGHLPAGDQRQLRVDHVARQLAAVEEAGGGGGVDGEDVGQQYIGQLGGRGVVVAQRLERGHHVAVEVGLVACRLPGVEAVCHVLGAEDGVDRRAG